VRRGQEPAVVKYERRTTDDNAKIEELNTVWCDMPDMETEASLTVCATALATSESPEPCAAPTAAPLPERSLSLDVRPAQAWGRQADIREAERKLRKRLVAFSCWSQQHGQTLSAVGAAVDVSTRTLSRWRRHWHTDRLALRPRGRPCRCAAPAVRRDVVAFLDERGPGTGLPTLRNHYPQVARAELIELLTTYRGDYRQAHARQQAELHWLRPGSVWAMDFSHPPVLIDGCFPAIFTVRDLASHQQLLWLPVEDETADTVIDTLLELFEEQGAPLVLKCDNGPGFVAQALKQFLCDRSVVTLYSPAYAPWYNGAVERANRSLKEITEHLAERGGHAGYWTSPDLHAARLQLNRLTRAWAADGSTPEEPCPEEVWQSRESLKMDERDVLFEKLELARRALCREREVDPDAPLAHRLESEFVRVALQPVLESNGYLYVTRRRIAPVLFRQKCDKIM
jgi:transposase InsO family protein